MKKFAIYLPQFHEIAENNEWWGNGFTEWVNVKKAEKLFLSHKQPKIPLNNNYYDLNNLSVLKWQADLLKQFKLTGMVFYHYYFKGKKLLERPAEMLIGSDINLPFFFCWANHNWYRSWEGSKEILLEQVYGDENDWNNHFEYLLSFFKDDRYEKINNKPILMIFYPYFKEKRRMFDFFNKKCLENGFNGIYIIETCNSYSLKMIKELKDYECEYEKRVYIREPDATLNELKKMKKFTLHKIKNNFFRLLKTKNCKPILCIPGDWMYKIIINKLSLYKDEIHGLFFEWDNTPRHNLRGFVIEPVSEKMIQRYFRKLDENTDYLIINAWNEWCEGMILEPTEQDGYKYLEWLKEYGNMIETKG